MSWDSGDAVTSTEDLGSRNAASVRTRPDAITKLSALLGISEEEVRDALSNVHGRTLVRTVFKGTYAVAAGEIVEEQDEEGPTGVEEEIDTESSVVSPYDPDKIRVDPKTFSLYQIIEDIKTGDIDLAPDFQRNKVWGKRQKVRLVESVLLRIPLPAFYFSADKSGKLSVVDGVQRLSTLHGFFGGDFALTRSDLEYLSVDLLRRPDLLNNRQGYTECFFADLDSQWTRRLRQTQFTAYVIDPQTPEQVKFDIFKRINTGGSPLNAQEIRHSMMKTRSRDFLKDLGESEAFRNAVPDKLRGHARMADREVILRFLAFALLEDIERYPDTTMDAFLMDTARRLDDPAEVDDSTLANLRTDFETAMRNAAFLFGGHAFRKWPTDKERLHPFNKALFESWGSALRKKSRSSLEPQKEAIVQAARELMDDREYVEAITLGTGDVAKVKARFRAAASVIARYAP